MFVRVSKTTPVMTFVPETVTLRSGFDTAVVACTLPRTAGVHPKSLRGLKESNNKLILEHPAEGVQIARAQMHTQRPLPLTRPAPGGRGEQKCRVGLERPNTRSPLRGFRATASEVDGLKATAPRTGARPGLQGTEHLILRSFVSVELHVRSGPQQDPQQASRNSGIHHIPPGSHPPNTLNMSCIGWRC